MSQTRATRAVFIGSLSFVRKARDFAPLGVCLLALIGCRTYTEDLLRGTVGAGGHGAAGGNGMAGNMGQGAASSHSSTANGGGGSGGVGGSGRVGGAGGEGGTARSNGQPCARGSECESTQCVDEVCCLDACDSLCSACNVTGNAGVCTPIPDGSDPDVECGADSCNGEGGCRCTDGKLSTGESAADCGGGVCPACTDGKTCNMDNDCVSGVCMTTCQPPSCTDLAQNGDETAVDCGGSCPNGCPNGSGCINGTDCLSQICMAATCQPGACGDGFVNTATEACDDGNNDSFDGCSAGCLLPSSHLLLSEVVVAPTGAEMVEIYNPTNSAAPFDDHYIADFNTYYAITTGGAIPSSADFLARFPANSSVAAGGFVVVSLESATAFKAAYGKDPSFDFDPNDNGAPVMLGTFGPNSGLTNTGEMVVLFQWDGSSDLVSDVDYTVYGNTANAANKTGITVGQSTYKNDTPAVNQVPAKAPLANKSIHRCDTAEASETTSGGNGLSGHDETSENGLSAWTLTAGGSPLAPPAKNLCP